MRFLSLTHIHHHKKSKTARGLFITRLSPTTDSVNPPESKSPTPLRPLKIFHCEFPYSCSDTNVCVCVCVLVAKSCPTLCDSMDCSPPGSLSVQFSRQEYWSGLPFPSPGNLPNPGIKPGSNGCPLFQPSDVVATPPPSFCTTLAKGEAGIFLALLCFLQREL